MPISYSLVLAAVAPFCGYLQDLFGRRNITLAGGLVLCVGIVVVATAQNIGAAVGGMAVAGAGAAIGELTALAGCVSFDRRRRHCWASFRASCWALLC